MHRLASPLLEKGPVLNISFYRFVSLVDPNAVRTRVKARALEAGLKGSILLSHEGINGFLAAEEGKVRAFTNWLFTEFEEFRGIAPKESFSTKIPFRRMLVKVKSEIITMGRPEIRPSETTGKNIKPAELKQWYDDKKDFVILDTRNDYEIAQGTFKGAIDYGIETFREFPEKLEANAAALRDKTVVMFCTGGIRCEKATALAMGLGMKDVYQLEGGILKYFEEVGGVHYRGDCFVFDHRTNVDAGLEPLRDRKLKERVVGIRVFVSGLDPQSERVVLALRAKRLPAEVVEMDLAAAEELELTALGALNPHRELPVLRHGDVTLYPSSTILAYLDEAFPETSPLLPEKPERRARARLWIDWADRVFGRDVETFLRSRDSLSPEDRHALEVRLEKHLYRLKTPLQRNREFLVVGALTHGDLAAYTQLRRLRETGFPTDYPERFELVWKWSKRVEALTSESARSPSRELIPENSIHR